MQKSFILLILLSLSIVSCIKEHSFNEATTNNAGTSIQPLEEKSLHPSIVNSSWWKNMSSLHQAIYELELSGSHNVLSYTDLHEIRQLKARNLQISTYTNSRKSKCVSPGFPAPNPEGDVVLTTQAEVDAFGATGCDEISGLLEINDTVSADPITDLSPLSKVKHIGSSMTIISTSLTNLSGLDNLKTIGELGPFGFVGIIGDQLSDIDALASLKTITGSINVISCPNLTTINKAFQKITSIESGKTTAPLMSVFVLNINNNASLADISGFSDITHLEGDLLVRHNGAIANLDDLSSLNSIGRRIIIENNSALQQVDQLSAITSLSNSLIVTDNPSLTSCCGLFNLLCADPPACSISGAGGGYFISNNGIGCTDVDIITGGPCP